MPTKQISAVDWLVNELKTSIHYQRVINEVNQSNTEIKDVINQAKEMEKEQIIETWKHGNLPTFLGRQLTAEQYYNETFKQD